LLITVDKLKDSKNQDVGKFAEVANFLAEKSRADEEILALFVLYDMNRQEQSKWSHHWKLQPQSIPNALHFDGSSFSF
jgi:hypothetical protein